MIRNDEDEASPESTPLEEGQLVKPSRLKHAGSGGYQSGEGDNIKVYVRVRPPAQNLEQGVDDAPCVEVTSGTSLVLQSKPDPKTFSFDHVANTNTTQEEVFGYVGKKIVESCVEGYNGTIFAYGQTGSGKTFTMLGPPEDDVDCFTHELRGVIPRGFEYLFSLINREQEKAGGRLEFLCRCSFLEIYNEQIYDLLDPASSGLALREDIKKGVFVDGLLERDISSARDAYRVLNSGWLNRRVASTSMNRESSRSHAVFTITLESKERKAGMANIKVSRLHLVDLAGSERQKDTRAEGVRLKEAGSINKSLSALGNVIMALVDITHGKTRHVHYRDSKLTFLLRDSLGGNAKTYLIANVHPSARCFGETLSTLNFARRAKMIKNKAVVNEDASGSITALQLEIKRLREELERARAGVPQQVTRQEPTANGATRNPPSAEEENNNNLNNTSLDFNQQYKEWKEMIVAATAARERSEQEKQALVEKVQKLQELCSKKENFLQSTKMILRFRENHITKLERMRKREQEGKDREEDDKDKEIQLLKEEIAILKDKVDRHPDVSRFAIENLELRAEVKRLRAVNEGELDLSQDLAKSHRYTLQLERQLRELLQSPQGSELERSMSCSLVSLDASSEMKAEQTQLRSQVEEAWADLKLARERLQQLNEELVNEKELSRKKMIDLESKLSSVKKAKAELETALEAHQLKTAVERTTLNDIHMQTIKTLTTPKKLGFRTPSRRTPRSSSSTPSRERLGSPVINIADEKPPNGLIRRDSFNDSDSELDDTFFNFDSEEMDAEERYAEALTDEIKRLQELNNTLDQKNQAQMTETIRCNQHANKLEHQVQQLTQILASEREKHAGIETELNLKNLGLADKLKEAKGELTVLRSEVEDLRILLHSADQQLSSLKKDTSLEINELGRQLASVESKLTRLEIEHYNQGMEMDAVIETNLRLQSDVDTIREELGFKTHQTEQYEKLLQKERQKCKDLEHELQTTLEKLEMQTETSMKLMTQPDKQQDVVRALEQNVALRAEVQESNAACEQQTQKMLSLAQDLDGARAVIETLNKEKDSDKSCVNNLMESVKELKKNLGDRDGELSSLKNDLEESKSQQMELTTTLEEKNRTINKLKERLDLEVDRLTRERSKSELEKVSLKDELRRTAEQCRELTQALEQQQQQITTLQARRMTDVDSLELQILDLEHSKREIEQTYQSRLAELQQATSSPDLTHVLESHTHEIEQMRATHRRLTNMIAELENARQEKNEEIAALQSRLAAVEAVERKNELLETSNKSLEYELEVEKEQTRVRLEETVKVKAELAKLRETCDETTQMKLALLNEKQLMEEQLARYKANMEIAQEDAESMMEQCARVEKVEAEIFEEKERIKSEMESMKEEKLKMVKTMRKLEEDNARLSGHRNQQQKLQYLLTIKRENNALKEQLDKMSQEKEKCKCGEFRRPLTPKNGQDPGVRGQSKSATRNPRPPSTTGNSLEDVFLASI